MVFDTWDGYRQREKKPKKQSQNSRWINIEKSNNISSPEFEFEMVLANTQR